MRDNHDFVVPVNILILFARARFLGLHNTLPCVLIAYICVGTYLHVVSVYALYVYLLKISCVLQLVVHYQSSHYGATKAATPLTYIETAVSILHEMPWVDVQLHKVCYNNSIALSTFALHICMLYYVVCLTSLLHAF